MSCCVRLAFSKSDFEFKKIHLLVQWKVNTFKAMGACNNNTMVHWDTNNHFRLEEYGSTSFRYNDLLQAAEYAGIVFVP